jgi:succinate-semialdehyde dehydrogenase/glutarate-semialdehyde dehydrogenase
MMRIQDFGPAYVAGQWFSSERQFAVVNPATGEPLANVADLSRPQIEAAVEAASQALGPWSAKTAHERAAILKRWSALIMANQEALAQIMTAEQGKPLAEARGETAFGASFLEWFSEEAKRAYGDVIPTAFAGKRYFTIRQAAGVAAAITPWNFPIAMLARKAAAALAAGCTMVAKPAAETPLCALALAQLGHEAGLPPGVFNIVTTTRAGEAGEVFCQSPKVRVLSFTGSTAVGKQLYRQCADTSKKLALELGGNAPLLVFDDADMDRAIEGVMANKYRNAGQTCVCANRLLVQDGVYDAFAKRLAEVVGEMKVGDGTAPGVAIGPLIDMKAVEKVESHIADAVKKGAHIVAGGKRSALGGSFFEPTVLADVTTDMIITKEETFGPVAPLYRFKDEHEAIKMANDTEFGLASYFYSRDIGRIWRVAEALEYGIVGINEGIISTEIAPFGGMKESGIGREGSKYGIEDYLEIKYLCMGGIDR